jgi:hypothetical protein
MILGGDCSRVPSDFRLWRTFGARTSTGSIGGVDAVYDSEGRRFESFRPRHRPISAQPAQGNESVADHSFRANRIDAAEIEIPPHAPRHNCRMLIRGPDKDVRLAIPDTASAHLRSIS